MSKPSIIWTDERIELMQKLWKDGLTASQIAKQLKCGLSRNAILGKLWRLGHPPRVKAISLRAGRPKSERKSRITNTGGMKTVKARLASPGLKELPPPSVSDASFAKPWTDRRAGECAYPISGSGEATFSCCAPAEGGYCPAHRAVMFTKPPAARTQAQAAADLQRRLKAIKRFSEWVAA